METSRRGPSLLLGAAHLAVLWAFAFAQPLLNLLAKNPEFFVARHNTSGDIILFACALMIVPPALMLGAEALANLVSPSARWFLHLALVGLLVAAIVLQVEKSIVSHPAKLMVLVALAAGAGAAYAYDRTEFAPLALTVLTPVPAILLLYFLLLSDVSELVLPQSKPELAEAAHVGSTAPVVALFLDEFPASTIEGPDGQIDARRFPHFAELARASTWYRNATTVADQTVQAVPALMTGQTPRGGELPNAHDHPKSIFTLLGGSYDMDVTESVTSVCPRSLCRTSAAASESFGARFGDLVSDLSLVSEHLLLPDSLADRLPPVNQTFGGFRNVGGGSGANNAAGEAIGPSDRAALFNRFLAGIDGDDKILHFLHLELPHRPWQYLPSGQSYPLSATGTGELQTPDGKRIPNKYAPELSWQRHLLQAEYADRLIGQLIGRMKREGIWKKAALVVTPDHGMAFVPNEPPRVATKGNFDQVAGVPTFIKAPGQTVGEPSDRRICTTDVLPILAGLLDTPVPWKSPPCPAEPANGGEVVIHSGTGSGHKKLAIVSESFTGFAAGQKRTLAEQAELFGTGDPGAVYNLGQLEGLIGAKAAALATGGHGDAFSAKDPGIYSEVDPASGSVPALLDGKIPSGVADGTPLAIAVNGTVVAVSRAFVPGSKSARVLAMIPPRAFRRGRNAVEVYEVEGPPGQPSLRSLGGVNAG